MKYKYEFEMWIRSPMLFADLISLEQFIEAANSDKDKCLLLGVIALVTKDKIPDEVVITFRNKLSTVMTNDFNTNLRSDQKVTIEVILKRFFVLSSDGITPNDIVDIATKVMGNYAMIWLNSPLDIFKGKTPKEYAQTFEGYEEVVGYFLKLVVDIPTPGITQKVELKEGALFPL